ncbi:MAG: M1 family aminopeptidase [Terracidiphilus sp.]|jgi:hypothetical protein
MRSLRSFVSILILTIPILLSAEDRLAPIAYDLKVNIEPVNGTIAVQGTVDMPSNAATASTLKFNLHETMEITKLLIDGNAATFAYAPTEGSLPLPATRGVVVNLPVATPQRMIHMEIAYRGRLMVLPEFGASPDMRHSMDDQINARMVELAFYSSWFPQFAFGQPVKSELTLSLPQNWISICSGKRTEDSIQTGRAITHWSSAKDVDIVILASPDYKLTQLQESGVPVEIYDTQLPKPFIQQDGEQIAGVLRLFTAKLGETNVPNGVVRHVYSPKRKGQGRAGFARPGLIVTSEGRTLEGLAGDPNFSLFQSVAHEIAHYWWNFGAGQGDWINEAFAEYFSAIAVENLNSESAFNAVIADDRKQVGELPSDAPSLANVQMTDQDSFVIRYYKGSLMLDAIRHAMGDEKFFQACHEFFEAYRDKPAGTEEFRSFWKSKLDQAGLIDSWLDSRGGLPPGSR